MLKQSDSLVTSAVAPARELEGAKIAGLTGVGTAALSTARLMCRSLASERQATWDPR